MTEKGGFFKKIKHPKNREIKFNPETLSNILLFSNTLTAMRQTAKKPSSITIDNTNGDQLLARAIHIERQVVCGGREDFYD